MVGNIDDTFISANCYPKKEASSNDNLFLEITKHGGHCGFVRNFFEKHWWMEERAFQFIEDFKAKNAENVSKQLIFEDA